MKIKQFIFSLTFAKRGIPSRKIFESITAKLLPLKSIVSKFDSVLKLSGGSLLSRFRANDNVCNESSKPRNESCSMAVIWLPLRSARFYVNII